MHKRDKLPFDGVAFYERESMRYHSTLDFEALIQDAVRELPQEQLKIFLLATMAGLRRNQIDKLQWQAVRWTAGVIRIEPTEHFTPKTTDSGAAGAGLREIARRMSIPEGTVLAHAKRKGWTQQIQAATQGINPMHSNAITPIQALATTLNERKDKSRLHLEQLRSRSERGSG